MGAVQLLNVVAGSVVVLLLADSRIPNIPIAPGQLGTWDFGDAAEEVLVTEFTLSVLAHTIAIILAL